MTTAASLALWTIAGLLGLLLLVAAATYTIASEYLRHRREIDVRALAYQLSILTSVKEFVDSNKDMQARIKTLNDADTSREEWLKQVDANINDHTRRCEEWHGEVRAGVTRVLREQNLAAAASGTADMKLRN